MEGTRQLREVRAALFAAVCTTLSCTSHVMLSRMPLPVTTVAAVYVAVFAVAYALAGRERGFGPIAALLVPLELAADTLFTTGQHTCYGPAGGPVTGPLASFGADVLCGGGRVGTPLASGAPVAADRALPWLLLAAHVGVGLFASWWLRRGDAAVHQLLRAATTFASGRSRPPRRWCVPSRTARRGCPLAVRPPRPRCRRSRSFSTPSYDADLPARPSRPHPEHRNVSAKPSTPMTES